ncbi:YjfB family protein [Natronospira bacteriovora]|uniref:YjfB family protein n=1 Tax=Natronospira bacteriovora TaxID=3069753 RepID=A0ABU0W3S8_9GAMM|nr:YjfB family protein [Natronospira sp. AB-CW4]MDQ2068677.1 YjfB family protein [Natronospira sp. AB-CW4]
MADVSSIAALSTGLSQMQLRAEADVAVLRKAMDAQQAQAAALIESLPDANPVSPASASGSADLTQLLGSLVDVRA